MPIMARPTKQGIDYFPLDVGFFEDIKVRRIKKDCGNQSIPILIAILCNIYRDEGYYLGINSDVTFLIAEQFGVSEDAVSDTVRKAVSVEFFDSNMFQKYSILTSKGIQSRYIRAVSERKRIDLIGDFVLLEKINLPINSIIRPINSINHPDNKQSKEKKSKEKKSKEDDDVGINPIPNAWQFYIENINALASGYEYSQLSNYISSYEMTEELLIEAMNIAIQNKAPKLNYIKAIVQNWNKDGIKTLEQYQNHEKQWERDKNKSAQGMRSFKTAEQAALDVQEEELYNIDLIKYFSEKEDEK